MPTTFLSAKPLGYPVQCPQRHATISFVNTICCLVHLLLPDILLSRLPVQLLHEYSCLMPFVTQAHFDSPRAGHLKHLQCGLMQQ